MLIREGNAGLETCLLKRHAKAGFVPGAHVFPGGVIEADDADSPALIGGGSTRAARAAAVRECFEECGLIPALSGGVLPEAQVSLLSGSRTFADLLAEAGATVDLSLIHPVSRWITPIGSPRRYDTRFFVAEVGPEAEARVDGVEIVSHRWITPSDALSALRRGDIDMIMPTQRTLARLARFNSVSDALVGLPMRRPDEPINIDIGNVRRVGNLTQRA